MLLNRNPEAGPVLVQLNNAGIGYPGAIQTSLGPVTLKIRSGDRVALTGSNGTGKSLLLKTLAGQIPLILGELQRVARRWLFLAQEHPRPDLWPMNGYDWIKAVAGHRDAECALSAGLLNKRLDALSGGQWQRVRLSAAIAAAPELLLLDEPSNHLDDAGRAALIKQLAQLPASTALWITTHDAKLITSLGLTQLTMAQLQEASADAG